MDRLEVGEWVEPTKQRLDACLAEWVAGQRLSASTLSSYGKNIRLHVDPYPAGPRRALSLPTMGDRSPGLPRSRALGLRRSPPRVIPNIA
jgi:hypothetical protein